jgi:hypothetical protein
MAQAFSGSPNDIDSLFCTTELRVESIVFAAQLGHKLDLGTHCFGRPGEFQEQSRFLAQLLFRQFGMVNRPHALAVHQLNGLEHMFALQNLHRDIDAVLQVFEARDANVQILRQRRDFEHGLGHQGKRAFGSDDEMCEIVPCA